MRQAVVDQTVQPVANLATNPRALTPDIVRERRRNLAVNPRLVSTGTAPFTYQAGTVASITRNWVTGLSGFPTTSGVSTGREIVVTGLGTAVTDRAGDLLSLSGISAGNWVISVEVRRTTGSATKNAILYVDMYDADSAFLGAKSTSVALSGTGVMRLVMPFTAPAGATKLSAYVWAAGGGATDAVGDITFQHTAWLLEAASGSGGDYYFFDGASTNTGTITYEWTGLPSQSASVAKSAHIELRRNWAANPSAEANSNFWSGIAGGTVTRLTSGGAFGLAQMQVTWDGSLAASGLAYTQSLNSYPLPPGPLTASISIAAVDATIPSVRVSCRINYTDGGAFDEAFGEIKDLTTTRERRSAPPVTPDPARPLGSIQVFARTTGAARAVAETLVADGVLIESGTSAGSYFDGATPNDDPYVFEWAGTAHASFSVVRAKIPQSWVKEPNALVWQESESGEYFVAHRHAASQRASMYVTAAYPGPGTYTLLYEARTTGSNVISRVWDPDVPRDSQVLTDAWQQVRSVFTAPSGGNRSIYFNNVDGATKGVRTDVTVQRRRLMIVSGNYSGPFLDGNDFNWRWTGAPNASSSVGYPEPPSYVRNLVRNPQPAMPLVNFTTVGAAHFMDNGALKVTASGVTNNRASSIITFPGPQSAGTYTYSFECMLGPHAKFSLLRLFFYNSVTVQNYSVTVTPLPPRDKFTRASVTADVPVPFDRVYLEFRNQAGDPAIVSGDVAGWLRRLMLTRGSTVYDYGDGSTPGWRWTGDVNASESVGYPYRLENVAGQPLATISTPGGTSPDLGLGAFEGRTVYVVHDVLDNSSNLAMLANLGAGTVASAGRMTLRTNASTGDRLENRMQTMSSIAIFPNLPGTRTAGRHVTVGTVNDGLTLASVTVDSRDPDVRALDPTTGMEPVAKLTLGVPSGSDVPIFAAAYRGEHDLETRRRIIAWLQFGYGTQIELPVVDGGLETTTNFDFSYDGGTDLAPTGFTIDGGGA